MIPADVREQALACLRTCASDEQAVLIESAVADHVVHDYLRIRNTSDKGVLAMYMYLIRRCIERAGQTSDCSHVATAAPWEFDPYAWRYALASDTSEQQVQSQQQEGTPTNQFLCTRCGQRKCIFSTAQTRSADEGMTTFITCLNCKKNWKMN